MATDPRMRELAAYIDRRIRQVVGRTMSQPQLAHSSIEDGSLDAYDAEGTQTLQVGEQWDGTHTAASLTGPVPPAPSQPVLAAVPGGLSVEWDGAFVDGALAPMDFARVEVQVSSVAGFDPWQAGPPEAVFSSARGGRAFVALDSVTQHVALVCRSQSGKASAGSAQVSGTPVDLEAAVAAAEAAALEAAGLAAGSGGVVYDDVAPPGATVTNYFPDPQFDYGTVWDGADDWTVTRVSEPTHGVQWAVEFDAASPGGSDRPPAASIPLPAGTWTVHGWWWISADFDGDYAAWNAGGSGVDGGFGANLVNEPREQWLSHARAFTTTGDVSLYAFVRGALAGRVVVDGVTITEGTQVPETAFSGDTSDTAQTTYAWTGTPGASPSTATTAGVESTLWIDVTLDAQGNPLNTPHRYVAGSGWVAVTDATALAAADKAADAQQKATEALDLAQQAKDAADQAVKAPTEPPAASPTPEVLSGPGAAVARWTGAPDASSHTLHRAVTMDGAAPTVPPDASTVHVADAHSPVWDGDAPTETDAHYALVASNAVGDAPPSPWVAGRAAVIPEDRQEVVAGSVIARRLFGELIEAVRLIGATLDIPDALYAEPGRLSVTGEGTFNAATFLDSMLILGLQNYLRGTMTLGNGVTNPTISPTVVTGTVGVATDLPATYAWTYGLTPWIGSPGDWIVGSRFGVGVKGLTADGQQVTFTPNFEGDAYGGVTTIGDRYYALVQDHDRGGDWYVYALDATFAKVGEWRWGASGRALSRPTVGTDGTNVLVAFVNINGALLADAHTPADGAAGTRFNLEPNGTVGSGFHLAGVGRGPEFGGDHVWVQLQNGGLRSYDAATLTFQPDLGTPAPGGSPVYGLAFDGGRFHSLSYVDSGDNAAYWVYDYSTHPGGPHTYAYAWGDTDTAGDGVTESEATATVTTATVPRGGYPVVRVSAPEDSGNPDDPNAVHVYAAPEGAPLTRQVTLTAAPWETGPLELTTTGVAPATANGFAGRQSTAIGRLMSGNGGVDLFGDGSWRLDPAGNRDDTGWVDVPWGTGYSGFNGSVLRYRTISGWAVIEGVVAGDFRANQNYDVATLPLPAQGPGAAITSTQNGGLCNTRLAGNFTLRLTPLQDCSWISVGLPPYLTI